MGEWIWSTVLALAGIRFAIFWAREFYSYDFSFLFFDTYTKGLARPEEWREMMSPLPPGRSWSLWQGLGAVGLLARWMDGMCPVYLAMLLLPLLGASSYECAATDELYRVCVFWAFYSPWV